MWKLKVAEGNDDPWLVSVNRHVGRQHWEFDPEAGTPKERAEVEKMRSEFHVNRFTGRQSADKLVRMQNQENTMIALRRYNPIDGISLKVEVIPSSTTHNNPTINHNEISMEENEITIEIRYKNYLEDGTEQRSTFTLPFEDGISWENIYEGSFHDDVNEELEDIEDFARPTVIDAIARGYVGMVENESKNVGVCSRAMLVVVEVDEFDEDVQGVTFDLDEDSYNNSYNLDDGAINNDNSNRVNEVRALLGRCGVSFGKQSSSGGCCRICLAEEVVGVEVAVLPCSHVFHENCIVNLVVKGTDSHVSCPLCRSKLC